MSASHRFLYKLHAICSIKHQMHDVQASLRIVSHAARCICNSTLLVRCPHCSHCMGAGHVLHIAICNIANSSQLRSGRTDINGQGDFASVLQHKGTGRQLGCRTQPAVHLPVGGGEVSGKLLGQASPASPVSALVDSRRSSCARAVSLAAEAALLEELGQTWRRSLVEAADAACLLACSAGRCPYRRPASHTEMVHGSNLRCTTMSTMSSPRPAMNSIASTL